MPTEKHGNRQYPNWLPPHVQEAHVRYEKLSENDPEEARYMKLLTKLIECHDAEKLWRSLDKRNEDAEDDLWVVTILGACLSAKTMPKNEAVSPAEREAKAKQLGGEARRLAYQLEQLGWDQSFVNARIDTEYGLYVYEEFGLDTREWLDEEQRPKIRFSKFLRALGRYLEQKKAKEPRLIGRNTPNSRAVYFARKMTAFFCRVYGEPLRRTVRIMLRALLDVDWKEARIADTAPAEICQSYRDRWIGGPRIAQTRLQSLPSGNGRKKRKFPK